MNFSQINLTATINHVLNSWLPVLLIIGLTFFHLGFFSWAPYIVSGLTFFIARYNFKVGYAVGYCEKNNLM
jgi:hypothetical protein